MRSNAAQQDVDALVGPDQAEAEDHRPLGPGELVGERLFVVEPGQVVEGAVGDHVDARAFDPEPLDQRPRAGLGVRDERIHPARRGAPAGEPRTARRRRVVHRPDARAAGKQRRVEPRQRQPLQVDDVGGARATAQPPHPGQMAGELRRPRPRSRRAPRPARRDR